jgi:hypothetical protein
MTKAEFIEEVAEMIADALLRSQGLMDWKPEPDPEQIATRIAEMVPTHFTDEDL